ncbi:4849_t:CDS:2 [Paraglomus occultum]|uniref:4849_t:CDS:1 n=1 Tax=Paraglomus occultum TaxID=144539 RepID=A0A9N8ZLQ4_9GLOM|nr:4849_t:CDS:2 [Paraglomus occultum]
MFDLSSNYSLFTLPVAVVLAYAPHFLKGSIVVGQTGKWNNISPRSNVDKAEKMMTQAAFRKAKRCEAAHQNGLESFSIFAGAVIAANYANVSNVTLNIASWSYVLCRMIYNYVYINGESQAVGNLRSLIWFISFLIPSYLYVLAAGSVA